MKMFLHGLSVVVFFCSVVPCVQAAGEFQNYDNDPILEKAWLYDSEHTTDKSKVNRDKAVEYYLEYLKREDLPSFQQAKVYVQLAVQYTTLSDPQKGVMPDVEKARGYLEKALELEPERIGLTTVRARSFLASVLQTREGTVGKDMDNYEWILSLDQAKVEELALPIAPGDVGWLEKRRTEILNYAQGVGRTTAVNTIASVRLMKDKEVWFEKIIGRFPGTEIAEMASRELAILQGRASDGQGRLAVGAAQAEASPLTVSVQSPAPVEEPVQPSPAAAASVPKGAEAKRGGPYIWPVIIVAAAAIGAGVFLLKKKKCRAE